MATTLDCIVVEAEAQITWSADSYYREKFGGKFGVTVKSIQSCVIDGRCYQIEDDKTWKTLGERGNRSGVEVVAVCMETCQLVVLRFEKL